MVNFGPLTPEIMQLITHPKSTVRILHMLMHLSLGHMTDAGGISSPFKFLCKRT